MGKVLDRSLEEGVNFKLPFIDRVIKMNVKVQTVESDIEAATKDIQAVQTSLSVNFKVNSSQASNLYKTIGTRYTDSILLPAIKESAKSVISRYDAEQIHTNRSMLSIEIAEELQKKVTKYGLIIEDVNLINFSLSQEFMRAIEEKQIAAQEVAKAQQELEKAKIKSEQKLVEAKAEADANALLNSTLTKEVLTQQFLDKWDGKLPTVSGSDGVMIDIDSLIK